MIMMIIMSLIMIIMMRIMILRIMMSDNDDNNDKLTFSDNEETKKQDHGVTGEDEVAAIFLRKHFYSTLTTLRENGLLAMQYHIEISQIIMILIIMINNS